MKKTIFLFLELIMITSFMHSQKLHKAVKKGNFDEVKKLVEMGEDINKVRLGDAPLHLAVKKGNYEIVKYLIEQDADVNVKKTLNKKTPLHLAVSLNEKECKDGLEIIKLLLEKKADVNAKVKVTNFTPLYLCLENKNQQFALQAAQILIEKGADINTSGSFGLNILFRAAELGNYDFAKLLLDNKSDVNMSSALNETPLHVAARNEKYDVVKLFIERGADVNAKNKKGKTPLHYAAENSLTYVNATRTAEILINNNANVNAMDKNGRTPLHDLVFLCRYVVNLDFLSLLLDNDANVNAKTNDGKTPLHYFVKNAEQLSNTSGSNTSKGLKILLEKGADITTQSNDGKTPMHIAIMAWTDSDIDGPKLDIVKILLNHAKNNVFTDCYAMTGCYDKKHMTIFSYKDEDDKTIFDYAQKGGDNYVNLIKDLLKK